jgi:hypothetical protein
LEPAAAAPAAEPTAAAAEPAAAAPAAEPAAAEPAAAAAEPAAVSAEVVTVKPQVQAVAAAALSDVRAFRSSNRRKAHDEKGLIEGIIQEIATMEKISDGPPRKRRKKIPITKVTNVPLLQKKI